MAEDDDQRQVERVSGTVRPEVDIPRPEAGEEMDVGEPTVVEDQQAVQQPVPTVRVGGSSISGTRAGSGSRANEANTGDLEVKTCQIHREPRPEEARRRCGRTGSEGGRTTS